MQVHGRGQLTFQERLAVEREYVENYNVKKDLRILLRTIGGRVAGRRRLLTQRSATATSSPSPCYRARPREAPELNIHRSRRGRSDAARPAGGWPCREAEGAVRVLRHGAATPRCPSRTVSDAALEQQMALMARSGVESVRVTFGWADSSRPRAHTTGARLDRVVAAAARHRLAVLINVTEPTPLWASREPEQPGVRPLPARGPGPVRRAHAAGWSCATGRTARFWAANPSLPKVPVRQWQVWNEQTRALALGQPALGAAATPKLLQGHLPGDQGRDRGAKVVAGSFVAFGRTTASGTAIRDLYRAGAKGCFDEIAVHPFTNNPQLGERHGRPDARDRPAGARGDDASARDGRKPIILTELTWPAADGQGARRGAARPRDHHARPGKRPAQGRLHASWRAAAQAAASRRPTGTPGPPRTTRSRRAVGRCPSATRA